MLSTNLSTLLATESATQLGGGAVPPATPATKLDGLTYVLDAADVVLASTKIATFNGPTPVTQSTDAQRATLVASDAGFGGQPSAVFAGTQWYSLGDLSAWTQGEVFAVLKMDADPSASIGLSGVWALGDTNTTHHPYTNGVIYHNFGSDRKDSLALDPTPSLAAAHVLNVRSAANNWALTLNGPVLMSTVTSTVTFPAAGYVGRNPANNANLAGRLAYLALCNKVQTASARAWMIAYLGARFGITTS